MGFSRFLWDLEDEEQGNVQHIAEHGLTPDEVEDVLRDPVEIGTSDSSGNPAAWGYTTTGRWIIVIYEEIDEDTVRPITAYETAP